MITTAVIAFNIVLGLVYMQYGTMTLLEMIKNRRTMGFSHFGAAWIAMAFTCGPHHWFHGIHLMEWGGKGGPLDLIAVLVGFPAGVIWFGLRVEAYRGGRGDRHVSGTPHWIMALPTLGYSDQLPPMATAASGVFVVNSAHIVKGTLNVNEVIELAEDAFNKILRPAISVHHNQKAGDGVAGPAPHVHAPTARELVARS